MRFPRLGTRLLVDAALVVFGGLALVEWIVTLAHVSGMDYLTYRYATASWLAGQGFYHANQLAGGYPLIGAEVLYPPPAVLLFAPFTVLPAILWWAIPTIGTAWTVLSWRPSRRAWLGILACLSIPTTAVNFDTGNPTIWMMLAVALATRWGWPIVLLALKPPFLPLALPWIRQRSVWIAGAVVLALSLAFGSMWYDWVTVIRNVSAWPAAGPLYTLLGAPLLAVPLIAWLGRSNEPGAIWRTVATPMRLGSRGGSSGSETALREA